jgi:hypothetical protein
MTKMYIPLCYWCKHYYDVEKRASIPQCEAYQEAIPQAIWESQLDHRHAIEGDNSIHFEQLEDFSNLPSVIKSFLEIAEISSETALRMTFDQLEEKDAWQWDERYPRIKADENR